MAYSHYERMSAVDATFLEIEDEKHDLVGAVRAGFGKLRKAGEVAPPSRAQRARLPGGDR